MTLLTVLPRLRTNNLKGLGATLTVNLRTRANAGKDDKLAAGHLQRAVGRCGQSPPKSRNYKNGPPTLHSSLDQNLEAAEDQPLTVEGHWVDVGLNTRVGHHFFHALVAALL
ncbi:MAG: hypothetical protein QOF46_184, partial [Paraburkholderia sp.]|nr:hypothetical protein [Paraburkholderia sp.]